MALNGRSIAIDPSMMAGIHRTRWSHIGGVNVISSQNANPVTIGPIMNITKTAGPSPLSCALRSRSQWVQRSATVKSPPKSLPVPHLGHRHCKPVT